MKRRNPLIDNAKVVLIFFVVFGHVIQPFKAELKEIEVLYNWIYFFHMPAFILLSGLFAKGIADKGYLAKLFKRLIIPYVVFHFFYTLYYYLSTGADGWEWTVLNPQWSLWFLLSLFFWHLMIIVFKKIPTSLSVIIAIEIGLIAGFINEIGYTLSLSRTFVFFPFFLIGYFLTDKHLLALKRTWIKGLAILILTSVAVGLFLAPSFPPEWILATTSYEQLNAAGVGALARFAFYILSILMIGSVIAWVPETSNRFTHIGQKTMYVYLLHGVFIYLFRSNNMFKIDNVIDLFGLGLISFGIVLLLSSKPVRMITEPLVEAKWSLIRQRLNQNNQRKTYYETKSS
ncbi:acyltransferase family protein [Aquibacillus salsiterrae]|uniref:Acyltransferase family protein n=1 Tax=Aquibacillus salsiterrae TaxID=2950439 RepID=A0A9X4AF63_9BACI|nr:acyltransferase family protein [Aquibacillus salsiterrae]MDC3417324.1 acyltransferase family protein [Aquibacillus salsiterrae]